MYERGDIVFIKGQKENKKHIQGFYRPYLVISNNIGNYYSDILIVSPLTTRKKKLNQPTHVDIKYNNSIVLCEQIMTVNQDDCEYISKIDTKDMSKINEALKVSLNL